MSQRRDDDPAPIGYRLGEPVADFIVSLLQRLAARCRRLTGG